jgi:hypothetical protein
MPYNLSSNTIIFIFNWFQVLSNDQQQDDLDDSLFRTDWRFNLIWDWVIATGSPSSSNYYFYFESLYFSFGLYNVLTNSI